jgi:hypothetical protein
MPRLKGSADLLEDRRKRALALLDSGESLNEVGRRIGCNPSSVMRWCTHCPHPSDLSSKDVANVNALTRKLGVRRRVLMSLWLIPFLRYTISVLLGHCLGDGLSTAPPTFAFL